MAVEEDNVLLREARELYEQVAEAAASSDNDGGRSTLASLNRAVRAEVASAVREPLFEVLSTAREGVAAAKALAVDAGALPETTQTELREIPETAKLNSLGGDVPNSIRTVATTLAAAAKDPSMLYPRLLCGSIPVDPARVGRALANVNLDALSGNEVASREGGAPKSSADVAKAVASSFGGVAEPLVEGLDALSGVRERLSACGGAVNELTCSADADALSSLAGTQEQVSTLVDRFMVLFTGDDDAPTESMTGNKECIGDRGAPKQKDCVKTVAEGTEMIRSAGDMGETLEQCIGSARSFGEKVAALAHELKDMLTIIVGAFGKLVDLLKKFFKQLPAIIDQVRNFFVPSGLLGIVMVTSEETKNLVDAIDNLQSSVPNAESVESARGLVRESKSVGAAEKLMEKLKEIVQLPIALMHKLAVVSKELPGKMIEAAKEALRKWVSKYGIDKIGDKIEDGLVDVAGQLGGKKFADAVGDLLPFGDDNNDDKKNQLVNGAGNLLNSWF